jgi:hypothetical protein
LLAKGFTSSSLIWTHQHVRYPPSLLPTPRSGPHHVRACTISPPHTHTLSRSLSRSLIPHLHLTPTTNDVACKSVYHHVLYEKAELMDVLNQHSSAPNPNPNTPTTAGAEVMDIFNAAVHQANVGGFVDCTRTTVRCLFCRRIGVLEDMLLEESTHLLGFTLADSSSGTP